MSCYSFFWTLWLNNTCLIFFICWCNCSRPADEFILPSVFSMPRMKATWFWSRFCKKKLSSFPSNNLFPLFALFLCIHPLCTKDTELSDNAYLKSWVFSTLLAISILHINIGLSLQMIASSQFYNIYIIGNFAFQLFTFCLHLLSWIGKKIWMTQHISKLEYCLPFMRSYSYTAHSIIV